ncbi:hypothetical protein GGR53DRAFT_462621 [Hypoxylon sp. FL1150]|nr:hypothetical protein GGR53DRAFT_462621 [Hypoxylon sp. FL1150]
MSNQYALCKPTNSIPGTSATRNFIIEGVIRLPPTGLKTSIVGASIGGMMAASECWGKGFEAEIIEKATNLSALAQYLSALSQLHALSQRAGRDALEPVREARYLHRLRHTIDKYEDNTKGTTTAIALGGRCFDTDVIVAADGIGTKSQY